MDSKKIENFSIKINSVIAYLFVALFPFINFSQFLFGGTSTRSLFLILITTFLVIILIVGYVGKDTSITIPKTPFIIVVVIYTLVTIISSLLGFDFNHSFWSVATRMTGIWYISYLCLYTYILWLVLSEKERQRKLILTLIISTALYSVLATLSPEGLNLFFKNYASDAFTFGNSTFAGMYIYGAFILSIYYVYQSLTKKWWMYVLPVLIVFNPSIINGKIWHGDFALGLIGEARASTYVVLISIPIIFILFLISKIKDNAIKAKISYSIFFASILIMIASAISLLSHDGFLRNIYLKQGTLGRPLVWDMSVGVISKSPYLGYGIDNFESVFEKSYDNRLLQPEYGSEAWFDKAHNIFIDQLVESGYIGLISYLLLYITIIYTLIYSTLKSGDKNDRVLASLLIVYFTMHLVELQTAFDTSISYPILAVMMSLATVVYIRTRTAIGKDTELITIVGWKKYTILVLLGVYILWSMVYGFIPILRAEMASGGVNKAISAVDRIELYKIIQSSPMDYHPFIWRAAVDFQKRIADRPEILSDKLLVPSLKNEIIAIEVIYKQYINSHPNSYRSRLNLADVMIYQSLFGINKLNDAQSILDEAIKLVPQAPQPYWMKAVAYLYMKNFASATEYANKGLMLNSKIKISGDVVKYIETSIKNFPNIDLFFFKQI